MTETVGMMIGLDIGGTKIEAIALTGDGEELWRRRIPAPTEYEGTIRVCAELVRAAEQETGRTGTVGVGLPGTISPGTGLVKNANSTWLIGHRMDQDLREALGRGVRLMNDANCFALSEATDGAGAGGRVVFGVILGTGVGGGIVVDGRIIEGRQSIAGEWGHNPLPRRTADERPGPPCYCGRQGCVETFLSGPGMERDHASVTGARLTTREIVARAEAGDTQANSTLDRYTDRLGRALAGVVNILDPDVIVLGGGMSNLPGLAERAQASIAPHVFTDIPCLSVQRHMHGDSSGVRGAAWLGADLRSPGRGDRDNRGV